MAPPGSAHPAFGLGALTILGGAVGYFRKGSKASLGAGLLFGSLLIGSGIMISGESQYEGHALASGTSGLMALGMGQRFAKTGKFMPAGLVAAMGAVSLAYHTKKTIEWRP
uniref:Transmembrane protein 14C n=1 Tax=Pseudictyota dubia TaxID=2749911 RepID=A0A7R9WAW6_9STRA|mmetsp:Transcript_41239/g.76216  ORF Transcript_41239/g.76216 Transcript_41239/m.76216 type:complete len:111 (+) Transcript_41239:68-400(+)|eukprot:CAMPEP_0197456126 /NCGR_PEP_ID=MMETSP1175-20131217/42573_1 /TAXON_ID=1003142 /ORGANISM="Triceratium dubium, Strain CCMP147" /LENGTH=110 /DNA_ID=CAMNT_0042990149 /DNA_START=53 /DNA_END=385 /DNA_ORIENTATION=-